MSGRHARARGTKTESDSASSPPAGALGGRFRFCLLIFVLAALIPVDAAIMPAHASTGGTGAPNASSGGATSGGDRYDRLWKRISANNKAWARRTSKCESGNDPHIHNRSGTYHGAFQFALGTWRSAPKSPGGDPHRYRWRVQAVVAVYLKKRDGAGQWPVCG